MTVVAEANRGGSTAPRRWLGRAVAVVVGAVAVLGLLIFTAMAASVIHNGLYDACFLGFEEQAATGDYRLKLLPPEIVCFGAGQPSLGLPLWAVVGVGIAVTPWLVAGYAALKFLRGPARWQRATRSAAAAVLGMIVGAATASVICVIAERLYVTDSPDFSSVQTSPWATAGVWLCLGLGAFVAALRAPGRGILVGTGAAWLAWLVIEFSGIATPLEPVGPAGAALAGLVGACSAALVSRRGGDATPAAAAEPVPPPEPVEAGA